MTTTTTLGNGQAAILLQPDINVQALTSNGRPVTRITARDLQAGGGSSSTGLGYDGQAMQYDGMQIGFQ